MKKFMKGCAITALIMIVLGLALAFAAGTVRGSAAITEVVERVTGKRIHINLGWDGFHFGIFVEDNWFGDSDWNYELADSDIFDSGHEVLKGDKSTIYPDTDAAIKELNIKLGGCSFETHISDTGEFYVKSSGMDKLQVYEEKGELHVKSVNTHIKLTSNFGKVILYVPEDYYYDKVKIELGAGEMTFDDLSAKEISMEVGAGVIRCEGISTQELEVSVGMGQIELSKMDVDKLEAEVGMGEFVGSGIVNKSAKLECSMGNVELTLDGSSQDYNYKLEAAAGNVTIGRDSFSGLATDRRINNNADRTLEIECSMGNIDVKFTE